MDQIRWLVAVLTALCCLAISAGFFEAWERSTETDYGLSVRLSADPARIASLALLLGMGMIATVGATRWALAGRGRWRLLRSAAAVFLALAFGGLGLSVVRLDYVCSEVGSRC